MAEVTTQEMTGEQRRASDRHKAATAAIFLGRYLGVQAEPAFDLANPGGRDGEKYEALPYGEKVYKDAFDSGTLGEERELQVLLVDEGGNILAESRQLLTVGVALELLARLPLSLSPKADRWLKEALGETGAAGARALRPLGVYVASGKDG